MKTITKQNDQEIFERIQNRIRWDIRVSNSDISILVKNGTVTLFGYFDKTYRHAAAVNVIMTTVGVSAFIDESRVVDDYYRTDKELEILISKQLLPLNFRSGEWIDINVKNGVVTLDGVVFQSKLKSFAARAVWELSGVKDCINLISLTNSPEELCRANIKLNPAELVFEYFPKQTAAESA